MIKAFLDTVCKELQKPKMQKSMKHDILDPVLLYILHTFAPYFILLCTLLIIIIVLLVLMLYRARGSPVLPDFQGFTGVL